MPYFHVVFTLPPRIGAIAYQNKAVIYDLLFKASADTLLTIADFESAWAVTPVGRRGAPEPVGVTAFEAADAGPAPLGFDGLDREGVRVPGVSPVIVVLVAGGEPVTVVGVCAVEPMYGVISYDVRGPPLAGAVQMTVAEAWPGGGGHAGDLARRAAAGEEDVDPVVAARRSCWSGSCSPRRTRTRHWRWCRRRARAAARCRRPAAKPPLVTE